MRAGPKKSAQQDEALRGRAAELLLLRVDWSSSGGVAACHAAGVQICSPLTRPLRTHANERTKDEIDGDAGGAKDRRTCMSLINVGTPHVTRHDKEGATAAAAAADVSTDTTAWSAAVERRSAAGSRSSEGT